jgi:type I restriction enzyme S subunit|nr:MAG TPA_asm: hypothetical protein [Caudoviricetes sp.]
MGSNYKKLGEYIRQIDKRNGDARLGEDNLYGISVTKKFIISHANLVGVTFNRYKVVEYSAVWEPPRPIERATLSTWRSRSE